MRRRRHVWTSQRDRVAFVSRDPAPDPAEAKWLRLALLADTRRYWPALSASSREAARRLGCSIPHTSRGRRRRIWRLYALACALAERRCRVRLDPLVLKVRDELDALYARKRAGRRLRNAPDMAPRLNLFD